MGKHLKDTAVASCVCASCVPPACLVRAYLLRACLLRALCVRAEVRASCVRLLLGEQVVIDKAKDPSRTGGCKVPRALIIK